MKQRRWNPAHSARLTGATRLLLLGFLVMIWFGLSYRHTWACTLDGTSDLPALLIAYGIPHSDHQQRQIQQRNHTSSYAPTAVQEVALGAAPHGLAVAPDGSVIYVTDFTARSLSIIDAKTLQMITSIAVGRGAVNVVVTADGRHAYVTNELDDTLSVIDTDSRQVLKTITLLDRPHGMALGVDPQTGERDRWLYVANLGSDQLSVVDTQTMRVHSQIAVGNTPDSPAVSQDGRQIWVTNYGEGEVSTLSLVDGLTLTEIYTLTVGIYPHGIKLAPDDSRLYVTLQGADQLLTIDTATRQVVNNLTVGNAPHGLGLSPDGRYLWTGDLLSRTSTIVDSQRGATLAELDTGATSNPHTIVFAPNGHTAYISDFTGRRLLVVTITKPTAYLPLVMNSQ